MAINKSEKRLPARENNGRITVPCALCGNTKLEIYTTARSPDVSSEVFCIARCVSCGLLFVNPRPPDDNLINYYPADYHSYHFSAPKLFLPQKTTGGVSWKTRFKEILLRQCYAYPTPNPSLLHAAMEPFLRLAAHRFAFFPRHVPNGRLLEVGCGTGSYLRILRELGWQVKGVEVHPEASRFAREALGLDVFTGNLTEAKLPASSFDAAALFHVLEHLPNPTQALHELRRLLKPGGSIYVAVPNVRTLEARFFKSYYMGWEAPRHLYHFSPKTLGRMLQAAGFSVTAVRFDLFSNGRYAALSLRNIAMARNWRVKRFMGNGFLRCVQTLYFFPGLLLAACGFGACFIVRAQKI
ncbi:MAG: class I SAM-dependent methyltransferase [Elusimicrobiota bacterium]